MFFVFNRFAELLGRTALLASLAFLLVACGTTSSVRRSDSVQTSSGTGGYYKIGRPYQIKGEWYYPKEDYSYDETGIASWYGDDFHMLKTANGEIFNKNELTAAHKTLPLPTLARVTNLENGRAIVVRVNDRGPFSGARIIDMSQRAAQLLGFERQGTAKVRVQVLADESRAIAEATRTYGSSPAPQVASVQELAPLPPYSEPTVQAAQLEPAPLQPTTINSVTPVPEYVQMPVTGQNQIYIQAGAFTNSDNALRLSSSLNGVAQTKIAPAVIKGVQYYRVRIGPVVSVREADKLLAKIQRAGADGARIIVD